MSHVGPIIFAHPTARSQLLHEGEVVTFRSTERTTGETWWRKSRTGEKMGDVIVKQVETGGDVEYTNLLAHADQSGFGSAEQWLDAIEEVHGTRELDGHLYRAAAPRRSCGRCGDLKPIPTTSGLCPACSRAEATELRASRAVNDD